MGYRQVVAFPAADHIGCFNQTDPASGAIGTMKFESCINWGRAVFHIWMPKRAIIRLRKKDGS